MKTKTGTLPTPQERRKAQAEQVQRSRNIRETVESIAIAFILAFLFRTFEAEAFVIPTGSMAPTLQGRHKDVECPKCDFQYQASASSEESGAAKDDVVSATCPMCRYTMPLDSRANAALGSDPEEIAGGEEVTYNGDRILVGKFAYEFGEPERWDVIVFKYPGEAKMNYIKRLVGLPNEEVTLHNGDVFARPRGSAESYEIARKPPEKLLAMRQLVHDNKFLPAEYVEKNWPLRWSVWRPQVGPADGGWVERQEIVEEDGVSRVKQHFTTTGKAAGPHWIRYQHFVPTHEDWAKMKQGPLPVDETIKPQLISDFYAYNTSFTREEALSPVEEVRAAKMGMHWVGDLMIETDVRIDSSSGKVLLDLVEGGRHFTATIDVATGQATLSIAGMPGFAPTAQTSVIGPGTFRLGFSNFDEELRLWVDGALVEFSAPTTYPTPATLVPTEADLAPVGVGSDGAEIEVLGLRIYRDIYYIADLPNSLSRDYLTDFVDSKSPIAHNMTRQSIGSFLADPSRWGAFGERRAVQYSLEEDRFFVLGDNSPFSADSRLWPRKPLNGKPLDYFVDRKLLIGKALFIYWPHSWDRVPGTKIPFPYFPNFEDMGLVR